VRTFPSNCLNINSLCSIPHFLFTKAIAQSNLIIPISHQHFPLPTDTFQSQSSLHCFLLSSRPPFSPSFTQTSTLQFKPSLAFEIHPTWHTLTPPVQHGREIKTWEQCVLSEGTAVRRCNMLWYRRLKSAQLMFCSCCDERAECLSPSGNDHWSSKSNRYVLIAFRKRVLPADSLKHSNSNRKCHSALQRLSGLLAPKPLSYR
jgi:hypothetical protein